MKDGAIVCNSGHFDVELELPALEAKPATVTQNVRPQVDEYQTEERQSYLPSGQGRLVNLAMAEGHPPSGDGHELCDASAGHRISA